MNLKPDITLNNFYKGFNIAIIKGLFTEILNLITFSLIINTILRLEILEYQLQQKEETKVDFLLHIVVLSHIWLQKSILVDLIMGKRQTFLQLVLSYSCSLSKLHHLTKQQWMTYGLKH